MFGACTVQYNYVQCVWIAVQAAAWLEFIVYVHVAIKCLAKLSVQLAIAPGRKKLISLCELPHEQNQLFAAGICNAHAHNVTFELKLACACTSD